MNNNQRGFTLIEMIVAVGLFAVVMVVCVAALLALANANRKAQALQSVMNNLNIALDGMVREIREGSEYHCGPGTYTVAQDCASSSDDPSNHYLFAFEPFGKSAANGDKPWVYAFDTNNSYCGVNIICRSEDGGQTFVALTASEVSINQLEFFVVGTARGGGDATQPKVVIIIKGTAGATGLSTQTTFHIQATAVQRLLDL